MTAMTGQWTEAAQKTHLAEGLAAAASVLGVDGITSLRLPVGMAFEDVWPRWSHSGHFPQVHAGARQNDIAGVLDSSGGRRGSYTAYWTGLPATYLHPRLRDETREPQDALAAIAKRTDIPAEDWLDLTRRFVEQIATDDDGEYVLWRC